MTEEKKIALLEAENKRLKNELEEFAYIASHDLKSPLANILGYLDILKFDLSEATDEVKKSLDWIEYSVEESKKVIENLVTSLKYKNTKETQRVNINLDELTEGILAGMRSLIIKKGVVILTDFSEVININYYPVVLRSILQNIISNACQYSDEAKPIHEVFVTSKVVEGEICISVADNGIGFDMEKDAKKITSLFKRASYQGSGTGMGMYIVSQLLLNHEGKLTFNSTLGKGSVFNVFIKKHD